MTSNRKKLFVLQMVNFAGNSGYAILIPLFPPLAKQKGVSDALIGYIFCLYPVGGFLVSIILGKVMTVQSMKMIMLTGLVATFIGMTGMGLIAYIEDRLWFILISSILRLITGIGATCCFTPSYGLANYLFPNDIKVTAQMQIMSGIALFSGPFFGSAFYYVGSFTPIGGFSTPMYALSLIYLLTIPLLLKGLQYEARDHHVSLLVQEEPEETTFQQPESVAQQRNSREEIKLKKERKSLLSDAIEKLGYYHVFRIPGVTIILMCHIIIFTTQLGARTYLAVYLQESYQLSDSQSTLVFLANTIVRSATVFIAGRSKTINQNFAIAFGLFFNALSFFLYGPDHFFTGLPKQLWIVCVADALFGLGNGLFSLCVMSQYQKYFRAKYPKAGDDISSMSSALYIGGWTVGEFAGPLLGGNMIEQMSFERMCSYFGFVLLFSMMVYSGFVLRERNQMRKKTLELTKSLV